MNIHEYQAKAVLRAFAAPLANGLPAFTPEEAEDAARKLGEPHSALLAGGRLLEPALAAPARMDLALHHPKGSAKLSRPLDRFFSREHGKSGGDRDAEGSEHRLGLVFMDVHCGDDLKPKTTPADRGLLRPISAC